MSQHNALRVLVVGGGLGGLCLAQGLRKAGIDVAVYERDAEMLHRMQGHRVHLDSRGEQALRACLPQSLYDLYLITRGQPSKGITLFGVADDQLQERTAQLFPAGGEKELVTLGSAVDRLTVRQILLAGIEDIVHFKKAFTHYEQREDGRVSVSFADGTTAIGDVLVAADGVGSRIRRQFLPHVQVVDTGIRWLGGKTLLTNEIARLLPASMHDRFAMVFGTPPKIMFGALWFQQLPNQAAAQFWPGLRFLHNQNFVTWGLIDRVENFPMSDEDLQRMDSPALQQAAVEITKERYPFLLPMIQQADPEESFLLTMRNTIPFEHWQSNNITLLGDAIHVKPANGSGANSALRDASQLAQSLITVATQETPLRQALHDYESEMLRVNFEVAGSFKPDSVI